MHLELSTARSISAPSERVPPEVWSAAYAVLTIYSARFRGSAKTENASFTIPLNSLASATSFSPLELNLSGCNSMCGQAGELEGDVECG